MKKFIAGLVSLALLATPVAAIAHDRGRDRDHRHRGGNDAALIIGLLVGGIILDRAIDSDRNRERYEDDWEYRDRYERRPTECWQQRAYDYYGRPYLRTVCEQRR